MKSQKFDLNVLIGQRSAEFKLLDQTLEGNVLNRKLRESRPLTRLLTPT